MSEDAQTPDLEDLNVVYDELTKDARSIASDLNEAVSAYYLLGFYFVAFSLGIDLYILLSHSIAPTDYFGIALWVIFANLIPLASGGFVLYRYHKLNAKYKTLFRLYNNLRIKENRTLANKKAADEL